MALRIAFATKSGKLVDEHFGRADVFGVYDLDKAGARFVEKRWAPPLCEASNHEEGLEDLLSLLGDCRVVVAVRVGREANRALLRAGFRVLESEDPVALVLDDLGGQGPAKATVFEAPRPVRRR